MFHCPDRIGNGSESSIFPNAQTLTLDINPHFRKGLHLASILHSLEESLDGPPVARYETSRNGGYDLPDRDLAARRAWKPDPNEIRRQLARAQVALYEHSRTTPEQLVREILNPEINIKSSIYRLF